MKRLPRAAGRWCLDSGGFTELNMYGEWRTSPAQYVGEVRRFRDEIGGLGWAASQDYMCEPFVLAKTGLTVAEHQTRTVDNYLTLRAKAPDVLWLPVIQGFEPGDYFRHVDEYARRGVDLTKLAIVGVGSVCRRQHSDEIAALLGGLSGLGIALHGFGLKTLGLRKSAPFLKSADSLAWSFTARRAPRKAGCPDTHKNCANCMRYAVAWRNKIVTQIPGVV